MKHPILSQWRTYTRHQKLIAPQFGRFVNFSALKHYFNVSNSYVVTKLRIVLFPWWHRPWSRQQRLSNNGQDGYYLPPRDDMNSPDMYIPSMLTCIPTMLLIY